MHLNVLIVGGGSIGERHLRCFQQVLGERGSVALCEPLDQRRRDVAERYQLAQSFATLSEAAQHAWHAAVICTPANLHVAHALLLAPVCQGVLIEKPLATRVEDGEQLLATWTAKYPDKIVGLAYVLRAHPMVERIGEIINSGKIGPLLQINAVSGQHFPTFRPAYREIYYARRETGGGAIQDAITHMLNLVEHLSGPFEWVACDYDHQALEGVEVEDTVHLFGRTGGGRVMASLALNQFMAPNESLLQLNGRDGSLQFKTSDQRLGLFLRGQDNWQWSEPLVHDRDELFRLQAAAFLDALAGRRPVLCSLADGLQTLRVNLAALASAGGRRVDIQPRPIGNS